ncbi:MAG: hypothetical protein J6O54_03715 [Prevotella sp.]|nr:hypothetical protein [Prevotella sp.]
MKKIFTLIAGLLLVGGGNLFAADEDVVVLSQFTYKAEGSSNSDYLFYGTDVKLRFDNARGWDKSAGKTREDCADAISFQNAKKMSIVLPSKMKVYKVVFRGYSGGDNWTYLYAYGTGGAAEGYEWVDPIERGVKNADTKGGNPKIIADAKYPLDPCVTTQAVEVYHVAGYVFAVLDFTDEAYDGEIPFSFDGSNQEFATITLYTSKEEAAKAPAAEVVTIGRANSKGGNTPVPAYQIAAGATDPTGISNISATANTDNGAIFNIAGQKVDASYKGLVIKNGKKYIVK